jgi:hypothetical protein
VRKRTVNRFDKFVRAALLAVACPVVSAAEEFPTPRVFRQIPPQQGQWRVEMLDMDHGPADAEGMPQGMTICMDSLASLARGQAKPPTPGQSAPKDCKIRLLEDKDSRAVVETTCKAGETTRTAITREAKNRYAIEISGTSDGEPFAMKARYSYEGPCQSQGGPAPAVRFDGGNPACREMRDQMAEMDTDAACAGTEGGMRRMCEEQMAQSLAQMKAMCP